MRAIINLCIYTSSGNPNKHGLLHERLLQRNSRPFPSPFLFQLVNLNLIFLFNLPNPHDDSFSRYLSVQTAHPTCQKTKCSLMILLMIELLQTSLLRTWQANSWTFWTFTMSQRFFTLPTSLACVERTKCRARNQKH